MTKERASEYLEDIRPTELRLRQVEYLLKTPQEYNLIRGVNFDERVNTYTVGDNTANSAMHRIDKVIDLQREKDELTTKLALYKAWIANVEGEIYTDLIKLLYVEGHTVDWIAITGGYETSSIRSRKARLLEQLGRFEIVAITQGERMRYKFD